MKGRTMRKIATGAGILSILLFAYGMLRHRYLINKEFWKPVRFIASERIVLSMLLIAYVVVNIPVFSIISSQ